MFCLPFSNFLAEDVDIVKKWRIAFVFALLFFVVLVGWKNKGAQQQYTTEDTSLGRQQHSEVATSSEENRASTEELAMGNADLADTNLIIREHPELRLIINAVCPDVTEARNLPCLTAHFPGYFYNMIQDFLEQFPEAEKTQENTWMAVAPESEVKAYITMTKNGNISFLNKELDVNGDSEDYDHFSYSPLNEAMLRNICSLPVDQLSPSDFAIKNAIQAVSPYTDFDLIPYNIGREKDSMTEKSWYRIQFQMFYQGTPISLPSQIGYINADVGVADVGIGAVSGRFSFSKVAEKGSCHVMSLEDILTIFEQQGYLYLPGYNNDSGSQYEIYRIQPEYFVEFQENPEEPSFQPVWSFYFKSSGFDGSIKFYADTGEICYA